MHFLRNPSPIRLWRRFILLMALDWHISLAVYTLSRTSLYYLSAPRQDQQLDEDRLVNSDKLRFLDYLGWLLYHQPAYTIDPLFWPTTICFLPRHRPVPWPPSSEMHADSNQYHQTYRKQPELSIIGLRLSWKYVDKAWIPATFSLHQPIEWTHTHSPLAQNVSENILIMWETYFEFMSYFILDLETCLGMSGQHHPQFYLHCWIRVRMQIWLRLRLLRQVLLLIVIIILILILILILIIIIIIIYIYWSSIW